MVPNGHIWHVISPCFLILSPVIFDGYEWFNVEFKDCGIFFKLTILVLHLQRPKSVVFQMSETVQSNISFTIRFLKAYHEKCVKLLKGLLEGFDLRGRTT